MTISYTQQFRLIRITHEIIIVYNFNKSERKAGHVVVECEGKDLFCRTRAQFFLQKLIEKIEREEIGTCARIEISQDAGNADQKVKWFLKVHKTFKLLWEAYFQLFFPKFLFTFTFYKVFDFHSLKMTF